MIKPIIKDSIGNEFFNHCKVRHNDNEFILLKSKYLVRMRGEIPNTRDLDWIRNVSKYCRIFGIATEEEIKSLKKRIKEYNKYHAIKILE